MHQGKPKLMVFTSNHEATPRPSDIIGSGIDGVSLTPDEFIFLSLNDVLIQKMMCACEVGFCECMKISILVSNVF